MKFPLAREDNRSKTYQVKFGGLDKQPGASDGTLLDMKNMSSKDFPVLAPRNLRKTYTDNTSGRPNTLTSPRGIVGADYLTWAAGTTFYYNGTAKGTVAASTKTFAVINDWICIFPDNKYYDTAQVYKYTSSAGGLTFTTNTIVSATADFGDFSVGTELAIAGCTTQTGNNKLATITGVSADAKTLTFAAATFTAASPEAGVVVLDPFFNLGQSQTITPYSYTSSAGGLTFTTTTISCASAVFTAFTAGDTVSITGCTTKIGNNKIATISSVGGDKKSIVFPAATFEAASPEAGTVVIVGNGLVLHDGEFANAPADANSITAPTPFYGFNVNDALTISGMNSDRNNSPTAYPIIREISDDKKTIRFYEDNLYLENSTVYIEKTLEEYGETYSTAKFYVGATKPSISGGQYTVAQTTEIALSAAGAAAAVDKYYIIKASTSGDQTGSVMYKIKTAVYDGTSSIVMTTEIYYAAKSVMQTGAVTISRAIPALAFVFENNNRLWGIDTSDQSIRCCRQGDPRTWDNFDGVATAAWQGPVGSPGDFTGGGPYNRKPVFHKEQEIFEVFGEKATNFGYKKAAHRGCMTGCSQSIQVAGEAQMYYSREGFMAYTGGEPYPIGIQLGSTALSSVVAGSSGRRYYASASDGTNRHLLVYDTLLKLWHREDDSNAMGFAYTNDLYMLTTAGNIVALDPLNAVGTAEVDMPWYVEFNDITDNSPNKKGINKVQIRLYVPTGSSCDVKLSTNGGAYSTIKSITAGAKQSYHVEFTPKRADHYRIKIEGIGAVLIYGISIQRFMGSEI